MDADEGEGGEQSGWRRVEGEEGPASSRLGLVTGAQRVFGQLRALPPAQSQTKVVIVIFVGREKSHDRSWSEPRHNRTMPSFHAGGTRIG